MKWNFLYSTLKFTSGSGYIYARIVQVLCLRLFFEDPSCSTFNGNQTLFIVLTTVPFVLIIPIIVWSLPSEARISLLYYKQNFTILFTKASCLHFYIFWSLIASVQLYTFVYFRQCICTGMSMQLPDQLTNNYVM